MLIYFVVALLALIVARPADAQMRVDIEINLPAPPPLVIVPGVTAVQYAPTAPGNFFFYGGQYWAYSPGGWHVSRRHDGPWIFVAPQFVPRPVLMVPVRYYHVPPGHWKQWERQAPPRWDNEWGRDWADKRSWKDRDDHHGGSHRGHREAHARGHDKDHGKSHGKGHGKGNGHGKGK